MGAPFAPAGSILTTGWSYPRPSPLAMEPHALTEVQSCWWNAAAAFCLPSSCCSLFGTCGIFGRWRVSCASVGLMISLGGPTFEYTELPGTAGRSAPGQACASTSESLSMPHGRRATHQGACIVLWSYGAPRPVRDVRRTDSDSAGHILTYVRLSCDTCLFLARGKSVHDARKCESFSSFKLLASFARC